MKTKLSTEFDLWKWNPDIEVPMGRWDTAHAQTIGTLGLGPCIGVAVYDPNSSRGYLSHAFGGDITVVKEMLARAKGEVDEVGDLDCWVSGGKIIPSPLKLSEQTRTNTLDLLQATGLNQVETLWVEDRNSCAVMTLDCLAGQCEVTYVNLSR